MHSLALRSLLLLGVLIGLPHPAEARDLQGRLGLGYNSEFANQTGSNAVPGVSLKYAFTRDLAGALILGVSTTTPSNTVEAVKIFKNLFFETNLNFYFMFGAGLVGADTKTGAEFLGGFGAEFYLPGVESLGFSVETGGTFDNIKGSFALKTLGVSFLDAGIHFYF